MSVKILQANDLVGVNIDILTDTDPTFKLISDGIVFYFEGDDVLEPVVSTLVLNNVTNTADVVISDVGYLLFRDRILSHIIEYIQQYIREHNLPPFDLNLYTRNHMIYSRLWYWLKFSPDIHWKGPVPTKSGDPKYYFGNSRLKFTTTIC